MTTVSPRSRGIVVAVCVFTLVLVAIGVVALSGNRGSEPLQPVESEDVRPDTAAENEPGPAPSAGEPADERLRRLIVGVWEDEYQGHRTMTLRENGTGTLIVELSGMKAAPFAARLQFEIQWSVAGGQFHERCLRGEPSAQVNMILKTVGDRVSQPILELTDRRLLLLDKDGTTRYDWRRAH